MNRRSEMGKSPLPGGHERIWSKISLAGLVLCAGLAKKLNRLSMTLRMPFSPHHGVPGREMMIGNVRQLVIKNIRILSIGRLSPGSRSIVMEIGKRHLPTEIIVDIAVKLLSANLNGAAAEV